MSAQHADERDFATQTLLDATNALLAAHAGRADEARALIDRATSRPSIADGPQYAGDLRLTAAQAMSLIGDVDAQQAHLEMAIRCFARKGNVVQQRAAEEALLELTSGVPAG